MKAWFRRIVLLSGVYDLALALVFLLGTPFLAALLGLTLDILSALLAQILGGCLLAFGIALVAASRNLDQLLLIPVMNMVARLVACIAIAYYVIATLLPVTLLPFGIIDGVFGILFIVFIVVIETYSFRAALAPSPAQD